MMNEERNVLDDLLDNGDDEDFDAELKAARNFDRTRLATTTTTKNNKTLARNNSKNCFFVRKKDLQNFVFLSFLIV